MPAAWECRLANQAPTGCCLGPKCSTGTRHTISQRRLTVFETRNIRRLMNLQRVMFCSRHPRRASSRRMARARCNSVPGQTKRWVFPGADYREASRPVHGARGVAQSKAHRHPRPRGRRAQRLSAEREHPPRRLPQASILLQQQLLAGHVGHLPAFDEHVLRCRAQLERIA